MADVLRAVASVLWIGAFAILPGAAWLALAGPSRRSRAETAGTALALSPGLMGGVIALLRLAGLGLRPAAALALPAFTLAGLAGFLFHRRRGSTAPGGSAPGARPAWIAAALAAGVAALYPLLSEWWRVYSDGWNHFEIVRAVGHRMPPSDPFFAGLALQYPWSYHALMAAVAAVSRADVFALFAAWSFLALVAVVLCAGPLAARLHGRAQGWSLAMLLLGLNAAFPLFMPALLVKAMLGTVRGWPEIVRTFAVVPFGIDRDCAFLRSFGGQDFFLNKFMVATPFALGLAAYAAWAACLLRWFESRSRRELWVAAGLTLAAGLAHPVVLLSLGATTLGLAALTLVSPRLTGTDRAAALAWAGSVMAGAGPAALFTARVMGGRGSTHTELPIDLSMWKLVGLYSCLAAGLLLAVRPALALARAGGARRAWVVWLALTLALATVIRTPGPNSFYTVDKFSYLAWIPLALVAGAALEGWISRRAWGSRVLWACLLFVPVNGLALAGRALDPMAAVRLPWRLPAFAWMRAHLPADAVLVVPYGDPATGGFVGRDQYMTDEALGTVLGYPTGEMAARRALCEHLFATDSLNAGELRRLRELGRPVYAVWTNFGDSTLTLTHRSLWAQLRPLVLPRRRPHWDGRFPVPFSSETHVVAELVAPRATGRDSLR